MATLLARIASRNLRWRLLVLGILISATTSALLVFAQDGPPASLRTEFQRRHRFEIPVAPGVIDERTAADKEIRLYYSADRGRTWQRAGTASAKARAFSVDVSSRGDGEYLFALMLATTTARDKPDAQYRPGMRVIVDTLPPKVELQARRMPSGAVVANWRISDALLDRESLQLTAGPANATLADVMKPIAVDAPSRTSPNDATTIIGTTSWWPAEGETTLLVRAQVNDRAGNPTVTTVQVSLAEDGQPAPPKHFAAPPTAAPPTVTADAPQYPFTREASLPHDGDGQQPHTSANTAQSDLGPPANLDPNRRPRPGERQDWNPDTTTDQTLARRNESGPPHKNSHPNLRESTNNTGEELPTPSRPLVTRRVGEADRETDDTLPPPLRDASGQSASESRPAELPPGERPRVLASRRISLQYDVASVGPSGVAEVELFSTTDGGRTWASLGLDADNRSPFTATLPGEGLYGFRLVVRNGNRVGGRAPAAGDLPEMWLVVDETKPVAAITAAEVRGTESGRELVIRYEAADTRLAARPITLYFSEKPAGPWQTIAAGLANTGSHSWPLDKRLADRVYLRLEVQDEGGNVGAFESANAIVLDESEPVGRIRSVESPRGASVQEAWPRYR